MPQVGPVLPQLLLGGGFDDLMERYGEGLSVLWQCSLKLEGI